MDADLLLVNGKVITFDSSSRIAEAVALRGKRIVGVGETRALSAQFDPRTKRIDLGGRSVLPGFYDAHPHMDREGLRAYGGRSILGLRSIEEILEQVALAA